jgi:hypothetical protein
MKRLTNDARLAVNFANLMELLRRK